MSGNLYTHARHHTGMMFCCVRCSFTTANRSHLTEHEQTHWSDQRTCELCHRNYKTLKSLINHTRKYHAQSSAGVNCLARLQVSVVTVQLLLHRCLLFRCNYIYIYIHIYILHLKNCNISAMLQTLLSYDEL